MSVIPPVDPDNPETRLLRAIFGVCPDCEETESHEHSCRTCGKEQPLPDGSYCFHEWPKRKMLYS